MKRIITLASVLLLAGVVLTTGTTTKTAEEVITKMLITPVETDFAAMAGMVSGHGVNLNVDAFIDQSLGKPAVVAPAAPLTEADLMKTMTRELIKNELYTKK